MKDFTKKDSHHMWEFSTKIKQDVKIVISTRTLSIIWNQTNPKSDASTYYLKCIKSTTPGDPLFQQMGTPQKNRRIRRFPPSTSYRSATLTFQRHHWLSSKLPLGPFLFRWTLRHYKLASHIMTVSKHVERPGTKEPLKNHQRNVLSSCPHWYWSITTLHLMESIF